MSAQLLDNNLAECQTESVAVLLLGIAGNVGLEDVFLVFRSNT